MDVLYLGIISICHEDAWCLVVGSFTWPNTHGWSKHLRAEAERIEKGAEGLDLDGLTMTKTIEKGVDEVGRASEE